MRKIYIIALLLISVLFTKKTMAQQVCHASFYLDTAASTPYNAVIVNNSVTYLTPPDSALYFWSFGDGTSSMLKCPTHTYTSPGNKYLFLTLYNVNRTCTDSFMRVINIDTAGGFHKTNGSYNIRVVSTIKSGIASQSIGNSIALKSTFVANEALVNFKGFENHLPVLTNIFSFDGKQINASSQILDGDQLQVSVKNLTPGMYFIAVQVQGKTAILKFIKQ